MANSKKLMTIEETNEQVAVKIEPKDTETFGRCEIFECASSTEHRDDTNSICEEMKFEIKDEIDIVYEDLKTGIVDGENVTNHIESQGMMQDVERLPSEPVGGFKQTSDNKKTSFQCKICLKYYAHSGSLKAHERIHTGERPFQCKICAKCFLRKQTLTVHLRRHNGEKPYQCNICSKSFAARSNLKAHEIFHNGEKPFQCSICSTTFSQHSDLKVHERIHSGEKPFHCKVCTKSFCRSSDLKTHGRIHTGEKPYHCEICSKSFTQISHLNVHKRKIHSEEKLF